MKRLALAFLVAAPLLFLSSAAYSEGPAAKEDYKKEIEDLKTRVDQLEKASKESEVLDELGHKLHPIHSIYGLKISGGVTITAQGVTHLKNSRHRGAAAISADIVLESPVGTDGRAVGVLDFQRGTGLTGLPSLFTAPNGNPTGVNNDIESFNNDTLHVAQFYYEHKFGKKAAISVGQLDPTVFFDTNEFANNERSQYLANLFVNNTAIEFGGTENFYSPGVRITCFPAEDVDITLGAFNGKGDYVDVFDNPFFMAELNVKLKPLGKDGNYRVYYWDRQDRQDTASTANPNDLKLKKTGNHGVGISFDQYLSDSVGVWLRAGEQRKKVAQFDTHVSLGTSVKMGSVNRPEDVLGFGYGVTMLGKDFKTFKQTSDPAFKAADEHYLELFYNYAINGATQVTGFHVSPDIQYVINPGGNGQAEKLFVYGIRLQAFF